MTSTSSFRASSSSSTPSIPRTGAYDVFLSCRSADTGYNFTDHLYKALVNRGIRTFRDNKFMSEEAIAPELLKAIEESRFSVIVFSENYAHSRWCLDELVKIMECQKDPAHVVLPIFYHVDPSHVRNQTGRFGEAFAHYEKICKDKIQRWRTALMEAGNLSGWDQRYGDGFFFAVKEVSLLDQGGKGKQSIYQLEQEISLLSQLEHDNIVQYYGTNKDDSKLYIFLELVTKGSLLSLYQKYHLHESQASVYTKQILNGLKYLHEQNVVHSHQDVELICTNYTIPRCTACLPRENRFTLLWKFSCYSIFFFPILAAVFPN